jgi:hypothetical protein
MTHKNHLPNPYGCEKLDLSLVSIPAAHKEWFARDILAAHWDKTYNLTNNSCYRWTRMYLKSGFIAERGTPLIFSSDNKKDLKVMVQQGYYDTRNSEFIKKAQELSKTSYHR